MSLMERRMRRQESASSALGGGSLPRPPNPSGTALHLPPTGAGANSSSTTTPPPGVVDAASAQQWEEYCAALEGDHEELRKLFDKQQLDLTAAAALLAEQKLKESHLRALEGQVASHEQFLQEVLQIVSLGDGGRPVLKSRDDVNVAAGGPGKLSMDAVRDAIQKQQRRMQALRKSEENNQAALRTLRKAGTPTTAAATSSSTAGSSAAGGSGDLVVPASAKELEEARQQIRSLERRLHAAESDARDRAMELKKAEQENKVKSRRSQQATEDAASFKKLLAERDKLLASVEQRYRAVEKELHMAQKGRRQQHGEKADNGNKADEDDDTTSNSVGNGRHTTTRHFRLLVGRAYVDLLRTQPATFESAVLQDVSAAVHVPVGFLSRISMHPIGEDEEDDEDDVAEGDDNAGKKSSGGGDGRKAGRKNKKNNASGKASPGVGVELDVKHNASLGEEAVDVLLLDCPFPSLAALKEEAMAKANALLRSEVAEAKSVVRQKEVEHHALSKRIKALEASLARRDADRAANDKEVNGALEEAEVTVKELYAALEAQRANNSALVEDLAKAQADAAAWELKGKAAEEQLSLVKKSTSGKQTQLATAEAQAKQLEKRCEELDKEAKKAALQHRKEVAALRESLQAANVEVGIGVFDVPNGGVALPSSALVEAITAITTETPRGGGGGGGGGSSSMSATLGSGGKKGLLKAFYNVLLCEVAVATGTVPVQVAKCISHSKGGGGAKLQLSFELAFYSNPENTAHVRGDIADKLASCTFAAAIDFLENQWQLSKAAAAAAKDTAALEKRSSQLQNQLTAVEKKLESAPLSLGERKSAPSVVEKIDTLVARLRGAEAAQRESKEEAEKAHREMKQLAAELAEAKDTVATLLQRVRRLEAALLEKQQQQRSANNSGLLLDTSSAAASESAAADNGSKAMQQELEQLREERDSLRRAAHSADAAVEQLQQRIKALERKATTTTAAGGNASSAWVAQLEEALETAEKDKEVLKRQMGEMETDMNDLSNIQASLQGSLEVAHAELRAKKQDLDLLTKQVLRLEEQERKQSEEISRLKRKIESDEEEREGAAAATTTSLSIPNARQQQQQQRPSTSASSKRATVVSVAAKGEDAAGSALGASVVSASSSLNTSLRGRGNPPTEAVRTSNNGNLGGSQLHSHAPTASVASTTTSTTTNTITNTNTAPKRIMKRSNSATGVRVFARTNSTPVGSGSARPTTPSTVSLAVPSTTTATSTAAAAAAEAGATTTTIFTRSATATTSVKAKGMVDAAPRLGTGGVSPPPLPTATATSSSSAAAPVTTNPPTIVLHRQDSRALLSSAKAQAKNGTVLDRMRPSSPVAGSGGNDVASLTRERRHVSPVIGAGGGAAFHRSQPAIPSASSAGYVRTPSGFRKVNHPSK